MLRVLLLLLALISLVAWIVCQVAAERPRAAWLAKASLIVLLTCLFLLEAIEDTAT
jgi:hypothetical protein